MKTPEERRKRLFKDSRPFVRPFDFGEDFWVLWAAYDLRSFPNMPEGLTKEQFAAYVKTIMSGHSSVLVVEDDTKYFKKGRGPCGFICLNNFGWRIEPQVDWFMWATKRMKLRSTVSFLHMVRNSPEIGVCFLRANENDSQWFDGIRDYGVLLPCGKVINGTPEGDEYLYYIRGRRHYRQKALKRSATSKNSAVEAETIAA